MPRGTVQFGYTLRPTSEVTAEVTKAVAAALPGPLKEAAKTAAQLSPYDPESRHEIHNRDSLRTFCKIKDGKLFAGILTTSGRGGWLETGTAKMAARPYIVPALMAHKGAILGALKGLLVGKVERVGRISSVLLRGK